MTNVCSDILELKNILISFYRCRGSETEVLERNVSHNLAKDAEYPELDLVFEEYRATNGVLIPANVTREFTISIMKSPKVREDMWYTGKTVGGDRIVVSVILQYNTKTYNFESCVIAACKTRGGAYDITFSVNKPPIITTN